MQVGQRQAVIQPCNLRHHAIEQVKHPIRLRHEGGQALAPVHALGGTVLVQHPGRTSARFFGRQAHQRHVVATLEVVARVLEGGPAFLVHQPRQWLRKLRVRIVRCRPTLGLNEQGPA